MPSFKQQKHQVSFGSTWLTHLAINTASRSDLDSEHQQGRIGFGTPRRSLNVHGIYGRQVDVLPTGETLQTIEVQTAWKTREKPYQSEDRSEPAVTCQSGNRKEMHSNRAWPEGRGGFADTTRILQSWGTAADEPTWQFSLSDGKEEASQELLHLPNHPQFSFLLRGFPELLHLQNPIKSYLKIHSASTYSTASDIKSSQSELIVL